MRELQKQLRRIDAKIAEAMRRGDFVRHAQLVRQKASLNESLCERRRQPMRDILIDTSADEKNKAVHKLMECMVMGDILSEVALSTDEYFRTNYHVSLPLLRELHSLGKPVEKIVATVDEVGSELLSYSFADMAESASIKCRSQVYNTIANCVQKKLKSKVSPI